jgi:hypothetical protein
MELDLNRVRNNVRKATTEDLLDRATVYRSEMEPAALQIIDAELIQRGIPVEQIEAHLEARKSALVSEEGLALKCSFCWKPAIDTGWGWHRLYGKVPVFPRWLRWCEEHQPTVRRAQQREAPPANESLDPSARND